MQTVDNESSGNPQVVKSARIWASASDPGLEQSEGSAIIKASLSAYWAYSELDKGR